MAHVFQDRTPPEPATPAGYAWLIDRYNLRVPLPQRLAGIGETHRRLEGDEWLILSPRYAPEDKLNAQVTFALKYEGVNLGVLKALALAAPEEELVEAILESPSGKYTRRFWFLLEWLTGKRLNVPDASSKRGLEPVLDPEMQCAVSAGETSERHRVINNLPGTPDFCPLVRRTPAVDELADRDLSHQARQVAGRTHPDVLARASAFMLLSDSKASFQIEQEKPSPDRARRWARAIARAGAEPMTLEGLLRLQEIVIGDARFVRLGLRQEGGFVGSRDRLSRAPLPEHISARPEDLEDLMKGLVAYTARVREHGMDPVAATAAVAFGFVYIHPFVDGNGRLHRWLIHHLLAVTGFTPDDLVFPVSQVMLRRIEDYRGVLESYSKRLLPLVQWQPTPEGNVRVLNDTGDFYRYFDATAHTEYLYRCVAETVDHDLPKEVAYLEAFDQFSAQVQAIVDMPEGTLDLLRGFLDQNEGSLSSRARKKEFAELTPQEITAIEAIYAETLGLLRV